MDKNLEKIKIERNLFANNITDEDFFNSISIDKTCKCINDYKRYGYSKKGKEITKIFKHNKERRTLLSSISNKEFINNKIINGIVNGETYLDFFKENTNIFKNRCILHNNARIDHYKKLKEYCIDNNIHLIYTPAYRILITSMKEVINIVFYLINNHPIGRLFIKYQPWI